MMSKISGNSGEGCGLGVVRFSLSIVLDRTPPWWACEFFFFG